MNLQITRSRSRKKFQELLGNANHLIITALVGLNAVERELVTEVPEDLHAAWAPIDPIVSARRSRRLIIDMALIRAIDAIDVYLKEAVRKPKLIQSSEFIGDLDAAELSISKKIRAVVKHCPKLDQLPLAIIFLMIAWRNRSAHSESDRNAPPEYIDILKSRSEELAARFRGLDVDLLLAGYVEVRKVKFKEVASLINAAHHLIADLDCLLLGELKAEQYVKEVLWDSFNEGKRNGETAERCRMRHARSIWGRDPSDRGSAVIKFLKQQGFTDDPVVESNSAFVSHELLEELSKHTPKSILLWANAQ